MASISRPTAGHRTETENTGTSMLLLEIGASRWLSRMASISRPTASRNAEQPVPGQLQATGAATRSTDSQHCGRCPAAPGLAQRSECAWGTGLGKPERLCSSRSENRAGQSEGSQSTISYPARRLGRG